MDIQGIWITVHVSACLLFTCMCPCIHTVDGWFVCRCEEVTVRSTGSEVVDKVRAGLSYNDIAASMDKSFFPNLSDEAKRPFLQKVLGLMTDKIWSGISKISKDYRHCMACPPQKLSNGKYSSTRSITDNFFLNITDKANKVNECLRLDGVLGAFDCKYYVKKGLEVDAKIVYNEATLRGSSMKTFAKKQALSWTVQAGLVVHPEAASTKNSNSVMYTLWTRMVMSLLSAKEASTVWVKPEPLEFFQHNKEQWLDSYEEFNLIGRLQFDKRVEDKGQNCDTGKPIITYTKCSSQFNSLYFTAGAAFDKYVRKHGATIVPARSALVWPGLSLQFHAGKSVPAWSFSQRPLRNTFARWIFDDTEQCSKGNPDNTVCANVEDLTGTYRYGTVAVIPWLGGDYNPWYLTLFSPFSCILLVFDAMFENAGNHATPSSRRRGPMKPSQLRATAASAPHWTHPSTKIIPAGRHAAMPGTRCRCLASTCQAPTKPTCASKP